MLNLSVFPFELPPCSGTRQMTDTGSSNIPSCHTVLELSSGGAGAAHPVSFRLQGSGLALRFDGQAERRHKFAL
jgi:hypothetical protein